MCWEEKYKFRKLEDSWGSGTWPSDIYSLHLKKINK